ncbi:MAG: 3',5'-cyclic-nucleotide phosphodiesterase [Deltaproteobacteria bacterium]|nr:3',5'-cyclic-nucleotide phosphodiesterase [Deltaproteobacteria bacterium]
MRVRILGCHGGETPRHRTTCFLIDDRITIDAGAVCRSLELDEQVKIDHMLISHSHMDHVKDLALLADQVIGQKELPIGLHCGPETAETLRSSYFNNYLWPDFTKIPTPDAPVMDIIRHSEGRFRIPPRGETVEDWAKKCSKPGGELVEGEYEVTYVPVTHPVESMAMLIRDNGGSILYSSDTGPTEALWKAANKTENLKGLFIELSFPNHMQALADVAGHYTPNTLKEELKKIDGRDNIPLYVYHLKPSFYQQTKDELEALELKGMHAVELTDEFSF